MRVDAGPGLFAARGSGLASGLALAVRPAGLAEVSGVNGAPQARPALAGCEAPLRHPMRLSCQAAWEIFLVAAGKAVASS